MLASITNYDLDMFKKQALQFIEMCNKSKGQIGSTVLDTRVAVFKGHCVKEGNHS